MSLPDDISAHPLGILRPRIHGVLSKKATSSPVKATGSENGDAWNEQWYESYKSVGGEMSAREIAFEGNLVGDLIRVLRGRRGISLFKKREIKIFSLREKWVLLAWHLHLSYRDGCKIIALREKSTDLSLTKVVIIFGSPKRFGCSDMEMVIVTCAYEVVIANIIIISPCESFPPRCVWNIFVKDWFAVLWTKFSSYRV